MAVAQEKEYSAKAIEERCGLKIVLEGKNNHVYEKLPSKELLSEDLQYQKDTLTIPNLVQLLDLITRAEYSSDYVTEQFKEKKKKRIQRRIQKVKDVSIIHP